MPGDAVFQHMIFLDASAFLLDRKTRGLSNNTILFYRNELNQLLAYCHAQGIEATTDITPSTLRGCMAVLGERRGPGGLHAFYRACKAFLRWYESEEEPVAWVNPIKKVAPPRVNHEPLQGITVDDFKAMIAVYNARDFYATRNRAILFTLYDTGVRVTELCKINLGDINLQTGAVHILNGKGSKSRLVFMGITCRREVTRYIRRRGTQAGPLFTHTDRVGGLEREAIRYVILRAAEVAGIEPVPSPHDFRRAYALAMLRAGVDIFTLSRLMGHSDIQILRRYLALTDADNLAAPSVIDSIENGKTRKSSQP